MCIPERFTWGYMRSLDFKLCVVEDMVQNYKGGAVAGAVAIRNPKKGAGTRAGAVQS